MLAPALGMTLASPSLNPAALTLSFILFPLRISAVRLAMALMLVLMGSVLVARITQPRVSAKPPTADPGDSTWVGLLASYAKSLAYVSLRTVPLILVGIWASMWIMSRLPLTGAVTGAPVVSIVIIALFAVLLTLPRPVLNSSGSVGTGRRRPSGSYGSRVVCWASDQPSIPSRHWPIQQLESCRRFGAAGLGYCRSRRFVAWLKPSGA
jgi:hypothetical protein